MTLRVMLVIDGIVGKDRSCGHVANSRRASSSTIAS
jgi:hypothetical protein